MFETFYGLTRSPFMRDIPTDQLYPSVMLEETLGSIKSQTKWPRGTLAGNGGESRDIKGYGDSTGATA